MLRSGSIRQYRAALRHGAALLFLAAATANVGLGEGGANCVCSDERQFSIGQSLFGKGSARVVISDFTGNFFQAGRLPLCRDLFLVGQVIRRKEVAGHSYLKRETVKRGTIPDICQTQIQFTARNKSYDFFTEDGAAITLSDLDEPGETRRGNDANETSVDDDSEPADLRGKDLIRLIAREAPEGDSGQSPFSADELKEGAYVVVVKRIRARPVLDDDAAAGLSTAPVSRPVNIPPGSLCRIQKGAGFKPGPMWQVELLPYSGKASLWETLLSVPGNIRGRNPRLNRFVLAGKDILEINRYLDKHGTEWTAFGDESPDARERDELGTTTLPDVYLPHPLFLDDNLDAARESDAFQAMRAAVLALTFVSKPFPGPRSSELLVLEETSKRDADTQADPNLFQQQCFVDFRAALSPRALRVVDFDLRIFQPGNSTQVSQDYYAVDLAFQLNSGAGADIPAVCRFPLATIAPTLLDKSIRILSNQFEIRSSEENRQARR
jgi:hypothetical protein